MSNTLISLSDNMVQTVAAAGPAVVSVYGRRRMPASGIVWASGDGGGIIVTAHHVLRSSENLSVGLADGHQLAATLVGRDPSTDLAILRVDATDLTPAGWHDTPQVGQLVLALGRPGRDIQATLGIVSAIGERWRSPAGGQIEQYLQTDVLMYPGFSGGPLVAANGQFLGLNTSALLRGVSLTIPTSTVRRVADTLLTHGRVKKGYLGVSTQPARLPQPLQESLNQKTGLLISSVEAGSPAEQAGLVLGDTIVNLDGQPIRSHDDLLSLLSGDRVGQKLPIGIVRGGELRTLNVTLSDRG